MLPFASGITGHYTEQDDGLQLELRSLRKLYTKTFTTKDQTVINTIRQGFSPILEDYLGDSLPDFSNVFFEMIDHPIPVDGEERELKIFDSVKMKFCWIPAGKTTLGSPATEKERIYDEIEHKFETNGFWMAKYPVTQTQWQSVMGNNPSCFLGTSLPVECVRWNDCQDFIKKCSVNGLRAQLPHENQWEYACRGGEGNKQAFYWGNELNGDKANCDGNYPCGTDKKGKYLEKTTEVGSYEKLAPHPWGLCDMSGNVQEWCENLYTKEGSFRVIRGGGWYSSSRSCRSSCRYGFDAMYHSNNIGFRLIIC